MWRITTKAVSRTASRRDIGARVLNKGHATTDNNSVIIGTVCEHVYRS